MVKWRARVVVVAGWTRPEAWRSENWARVSVCGVAVMESARAFLVRAGCDEGVPDCARLWVFSAARRKRAAMCDLEWGMRGKAKGGTNLRWA
jgi:hypothetical protein